MPRSRRQRIVFGLTRALLCTIAFILIVVGLVFVAFQTGWGQNQLRALIVRQANQYLTATLDIDRLQGSLVRGLQLTNVRLSQDGRVLVAIDDVSLSYSLRELFDQGIVIRRIRITRPPVIWSPKECSAPACAAIRPKAMHGNRNCPAITSSTIPSHRPS